MPAITAEMLHDYLHDSLPDDEMASVESALRSDEQVRALFKTVQADQDRGEHTIGAIWRRERISCPTRDQIGSYLLEALDDELEVYIEFHLKTVGCPFCLANKEDLEKKKAKADSAAKKRHRQLLDSTAGALKNARKP